MAKLSRHQILCYNGRNIILWQIDKFRLLDPGLDIIPDSAGTQTQTNFWKKFQNIIECWDLIAMNDTVVALKHCRHVICNVLYKSQYYQANSVNKEKACCLPNVWLHNVCQIWMWPSVWLILMGTRTVIFSSPHLQFAGWLAEWSTLIGRDFWDRISYILFHNHSLVGSFIKLKYFHSVTTPALLCHKEPARRILLGACPLCSSLVLYGIRVRWFPCTERFY